MGTSADELKAAADWLCFQWKETSLADEAKTRTAASRAYYAARALALQCFEEGRGRDISAAKHRPFCTWLRDSQVKTLNQLGVDLRELLDQRATADYDCKTALKFGDVSLKYTPFSSWFRKRAELVAAFSQDKRALDPELSAP